MVLFFAALAIGLVVGSVAAFRGRPAGAAAVAILGGLIIVPYLSAGLSPSQVRVVGAAVVAGLLAVGLVAIRRRSAEGSPLGLAIRVAAGLIGLGLAGLAGFVGLLSGSGPFT